jgi:hypothetical protein
MSRRKRKKPGEKAWWSDNQRIELVTTWLATGNMALAASTLQIPEPTARRWKATAWFKQLVEDIRSEENLVLDAKLNKVVSKSVDALLDRVENGDFQFDQREGKLVRKPISARDASAITSDIIDRRELLQGKKVVQTDTTRKMEERLLKLAEEFGKFASMRTIEAEYVTLPEGQ